MDVINLVEITTYNMDVEFTQKLVHLKKRIKNTADIDFLESIRRGIQTEADFMQNVQDAGWKVIKTDIKTDKTEHYDYIIEFENKKMNFFRSHKVEIKSTKKIARHDSKVCYTLVWVELIGNEWINNGWLNGSADLIAFELKESFILVKREALKQLIYSKLVSEIVYSPYQAIYKVYISKNSNALLTLVPVNDLVPLIELQFNKKE